MIENKVVLESKAIINLENAYLAQAKNYVVAYKFPMVLIINFGAISLQFTKIYNTNKTYLK